MGELKPCPFCGGEAKPYHEDYMYRVECERSCISQRYWSDTERGAVTRWNTRADTWIPVEERLPEEPRAYLAWCFHEEYCPQPWPSVQNYYGPKEKWGRDTDVVTHWQPLPEGPE